MLVVSKAVSFDQHPGLPSSVFLPVPPWPGRPASLARWDYVLTEAVSEDPRGSAVE